MQIEKLSDNKIRIIFSIQELEKQNIDYHSFMSNSNQNNYIFTNLLCQAQKEVNFNTEHCKISVETFELSNGNFIVTMTKINNKKVTLKRKINKMHNNSCIYKFANIDNFCDFCNYLSQTPNKILEKLENKNSLYCMNNEYFFIVNNLLLNYDEIGYFSSSITEFATFTNSSDYLISKFTENSNCIMKNNAINTCLNFFIHKQ